MFTPYVYLLPFSVGELSCQLLRVASVSLDTAGHPTSYFPHKHPFVELHYITQGSCIYSSGDRQYEIHPDQLLLIPSDVDHLLTRRFPPQHHLVLSVHIQPAPDWARSPSHMLYQALHPSAPILLDVPAEGMLADALRHIDALAHKDKQRFSVQEAMRSYANLLMAGLSQMLMEAPADTSAPMTYTPAPQSFLINQFFHSPSGMRAGAPALAELLNVSPRQLDRILLNSYGMNFRNMMKQAKLNYAVSLLSGKALSIDQIAHLLGYSTSTAFGAFIKKATGKTPTQLQHPEQRTAAGQV